MKLKLLSFFLIWIGIHLEVKAINIQKLERYIFQSDEVLYLEDHENLFTKDDVDKQHFNRELGKPLSYGFFVGKLWLKFRLSTSDADTSLRILELKNPQLDKVVLYAWENQKWCKKGVVGDIFPYSYRKLKHRFLHLSIAPSGKYLLEITGRGDPMNLNMSIFTYNGLEKRDYDRQFLSGMYFSILFFTLLVNLFIFLFFRERRNIYLLGYLVSIFIFQLTIVGYGSQIFWPNSPFFDNRITVWSGSFSVVFLILFVENFLGLRKVSPRIFLALVGVAIVLIFNIILNFGSHPYVMFWSNMILNVMTLITTLLMLQVSIVAYRQKFEAAAFLIISQVSIILSVSIFILHNFSLFDGWVVIDTILEIGIALQVIFITLSVISSFRMYKSESLVYLKEMFDRGIQNNQKLAVKIAERREEIQEQKNQLEITNHEIISSINYAKRIQMALLPAESHFLRSFSDGFVLYKPKEIVGGDFYWQSEIENRLPDGTMEKLNVICIGDSNDHGVPGALLGILYMRILQSAVKQPNIHSSLSILKYLKKEIHSTFIQKSRLENFNISCTICVIDKVKNTLDFAGSNASIIYYSDGKIHQVVGDLAYFEYNNEKLYYKQKLVFLKPSDTLYLYTDGITNQLESSEGELDTITLIKETFSFQIKDQKQKIKNRLEKSILEGQKDDITLIAINC